MIATASVLAPEAKDALRKAVRTLRAQLLEQIYDATRSEYRLDVALDKARLPEARRCRRERLESWLDEQARAMVGNTSKAGKSPKDGTRAVSGNRQRFLHSAVKEAAHTLLHRLVLLRILEHHGLLAPAVVTGGWKSPAYVNEFMHYAGPLGGDDTRGMRHLLDVVFAELAVDLPGLFGQVGVTSLFPIPAASLRAVVDVLNDPALATAWGDDTTLGWVYQYWNDPEREDLDKKIAGGGKIEPHEIGSKTQMFTERYMVEWLLQNSLGLTWLCICKKNGWNADADAVVPDLDARRALWREKRERAEVALDALMPIADGLESDWKYFVPQPIPDDAVAGARASIRDVRVLDPACGSGHFVVIAFGLLARMYEEEARQRTENWSREEIAASILERNLHGIDIDPRAVQIAAAALWLKAKLYAPGASLAQMNLVAPTFRLGALPKDDPAPAKMVEGVAELGIARELTLKLVETLRGVDYLGSLLRVDRAIGDLVEEVAVETGPLFAGAAQRQRAAIEARLAVFLDSHATAADLGLRLGGEQLAAGLRFVRMAKERTYDVVVGNPPYQALSKTAGFEYVTKNYRGGKADLFAAFLERGLELVREGGISALLTMRGWMFLGQFTELRKSIVHGCDIRVLGDLDRGAFEDVPDELLATVMSVIRGSAPGPSAVAIQPTPLDDRSRDAGRTPRKRAGLLAQVGRHDFDPKGFAVIAGEPIVYWWTKEFLARYAAAPKLGEAAPVRYGLITGDNVRFLRWWWELTRSSAPSIPLSSPSQPDAEWVRYIKGFPGAWLDAADTLVKYAARGLEVRVYAEFAFGSYSRKMNERTFFRPGVAFCMMGNSFSGRVHRWRSITGGMGSSVMTNDVESVVCLLNTRLANAVLTSLNPGLHFEVGDVNRLPAIQIADAHQIFGVARSAFLQAEARRETSSEFVAPGPSAWRSAQDWAQRAVDRPEDAPLPPYAPEYDPPAPEAHVSFAIGVALGRFGANGEGILEQAPADALPVGILFIGPSDHLPDSLGQPAAARIAAAWAEHQQAITGGTKTPLRDWLRKDFFAYHKALYENRPIYFPLSSEKKSFVTWTSIHRWTDQTLQTVLADHLNPVLRDLDGQINDLNQARATLDKKAAAAAEKRYDTVKRLRDELADFIAKVTECARHGAPPTDPACTPRAVDSTFHMDLGDGVMINSAALWPLLAPQWSDPKKWWKQLCNAEGKKDYDWAHLARRYFPARVDEKCKTDPSLAVAHGCFWKYHPAKAFAWELRFQDEIRPDFTIDEPDSDEHRARFVADHKAEAAALRDKERVRRERKAAKADADEVPEGADADVDAAEDES